jgi:hypothetical protein
LGASVGWGAAVGVVAGAQADINSDSTTSSVAAATTRLALQCSDISPPLEL